MFEIFHNFHFIVDLLIKNPVLHEPPLVELLSSVHGTVLFCGKFINSCKRSFSDLTSHVVHVTACPVHSIRIGYCPFQTWSHRALTVLLHGTCWLFLNSLEVTKHILSVAHCISIPGRNTNDEPYLIRGIVAAQHLYDRAISQHAAILFLILAKTTIVYNGAVSREILKHQNSITSKVDSEVRVGYALCTVVRGKKKVAPASVAPKAKA